MNARTRAALSSLAAALLSVSAAGVSAAGSQNKAAAAKPAPPAKIVAHCAITDETIEDAAGAQKTTYNGKTYYFCCAACPQEFAKNPAKNAKIADLRGDVRETQKKLTDLKAALAAAEKEDDAKDAKKAEAPAAAPAPVSSVVYCALTDEAIPSPAAAKARIAYNNKTYYLCCAGCQTKWDKNPAASAKAADERAAKRATARAK